MAKKRFTRIKSINAEDFRLIASIGTEALSGPLDEGWLAKREYGLAFLETAPQLLARAGEKKAVLESQEGVPDHWKWPTTEHAALAFRLLADARLVEDGVGGMVAFGRLLKGGRRATNEWRTYKAFDLHAAKLIRSEVELGAPVEPWEV